MAMVIALVGPHLAFAQVAQESRFEILRTMIADTAASRVVLPLGPTGLRISDSGVIEEEDLRDELREEGRSVEVGEVVTITAISFSDDSVEVELNDGGTRDRGSILDRITISGGTPSRNISNRSDGRPATGSTIVLGFEDRVPADLTSERLKVYLSPVLDFNKQNFMDSGIESLPLEFQDAVRAGEVRIGMDRSTVFMALDRPHDRIRERVDGVDQETWIYRENGLAHAFIKFEDGIVVETKRY
jgi:hypothetical protein